MDEKSSSLGIMFSNSAKVDEGEKKDREKVNKEVEDDDDLVGEGRKILSKGCRWRYFWSEKEIERFAQKYCQSYDHWGKDS